MKVLALIRTEEELQALQAYAQKLTSDDKDLFLLSIISVPAEIPTMKTGEVLDACTEFDLSGYEAEKSERIAWGREQSKSPYEVVIGSRMSILKDHIERHGIDLILTSTEVLDDMQDLVRRSNAETLKNELKIPVLSVKCDRQREDIRHIAILSDFKDEDEDLCLAKEIAKKNGASIALFAFAEESAEESDISERMKQFASRNALNDAPCRIIFTDDREGSAQDLLMQEPIQLLVLGDIHRKGLAQLIKGDLDNSLLNQLLIPILSI